MSAQGERSLTYFPLQLCGQECPRPGSACEKGPRGTPLARPAQLAPFSRGARSLTSEWERGTLWEAPHSTTPSKILPALFHQLSKCAPSKYPENLKG